MLVTDLNNTIREALAPLADSVNKLRETMADIKEALSGYSNRFVDLDEMCVLLKHRKSHLTDTVDDPDNRSRRCNLRVTNLAEKTEGTDPVKFMSSL